MNDMTRLGFDPDDIGYNQTANPSLNEIIEQRYSRRQALFGGASAAALAVFGGSLLSACGGNGDDEETIPPTVSAGQNGASAAGRTVTLQGTATDNVGVSGVAWTQVSGPTVALATANTNTATFTAPAVAANTDLVFRFTATDQAGNETSANTTVTVQPAQLSFAAVAKNLNDVVTVPAGYTVTVLYRTGDPLLSGVPAYANDGTDTNFAGRAGDHHDGMSFFGLAATGATGDAASNSRGLLVMNHENINQQYLHPAGATTVAGKRPTGEVVKEIECHGVSVVEISRTNGTWAYVQGGALNRRITPFTPMTFSGPVRGSALLKTAFSPAATDGRGTINNCANGETPWSTYLTCEENWAGYFRREAGDNARRTTSLGAKAVTAFNRYGLTMSTGDTLRAGNFGWATADPISPGDTRISKFNASTDLAQPADGSGDFRNEPNQYGWVVEIDPFDPASTPRKRTALGRMNHENCRVGRLVAGVKPAFYMGDDAQNEYIYKFVSSQAWVAADAQATNRLAMGDKYLDAGTLYVAKFNADGSGQWIPLVFGQNGITASSSVYPFADQADVLTHARLAGDAVGATKMDRPEWAAVNPVTGEMYLTLTNNSSRTVTNTDAANPRAYTDFKKPQGDQVNVDPPSPPARTNGNANGHIVRLRETGDTTEATSFAWDVFAYGANANPDTGVDPTFHAANINLSGLTDDNDFSSPDGLWFSRPSNVSGQAKPLLWIETDDGAYTDVTNCMLLAALPGTTGDGTVKTITNRITPITGAVTEGTQANARVGAQPGTNLKRFLVGPKECEITGIDTTPDGKTVFVNIQHPGENASNPNAPTSNWPYTQGATPASTTLRPRSATIAITKNDGGVVGIG